MEGACEVGIPAELGRGFEVRDLMGNPVHRPVLKNGRIALDECPVYLQVVDGAFADRSHLILPVRPRD